ncbi:sulfatase-like hydrolase/transferase, partial [Parabacteroides distasonis]|nr:sulfatase-like hydrolase/transferase [Parabacteroides distasonis]
MKKQVVLIMTDTTRKDMLGCYGNKKMITPNLDKLAEEGIKYDNAYTCQPVCGPARSALFTGTFPHTNGAVTNSIAMGDNIKTVGQRLTDNKIHCGYIGKWHLDGGDYFGFGKCPEGWDKEYWYDMKCYLEELTDEEKLKSRKPKTSYEADMTEDFTYSHRSSNRAIDFLNRYKDEDFFLTVSYDEPHGPSLCPAPYNTMYEGFKFDNNPNFQDDLSKKPFMQQLWAGEAINKPVDMLNKPSKPLALFLGCNTFVDYEIGRVIDEINKHIPDALIIFTSDHGDMLGAHRLYAKNSTAYKEVANIPLIIRGGEKGKAVDYPASHID